MSTTVKTKTKCEMVLWDVWWEAHQGIGKKVKAQF